MENDEQRDHAEELANKMIQFEENAELVFAANWTPYIVRSYAEKHPDRCTIEEQNSSILIATDLIQAPDGSLWRSLDEE